jgi:hypothetical protein
LYRRREAFGLFGRKRGNPWIQSPKKTNNPRDWILIFWCTFADPEPKKEILCKKKEDLLMGTVSPQLSIEAERLLKMLPARINKYPHRPHQRGTGKMLAPTLRDQTSSHPYKLTVARTIVRFVNHKIVAPVEGKK